MKQRNSDNAQNTPQLSSQHLNNQHQTLKLSTSAATLQYLLSNLPHAHMCGIPLLLALPTAPETTQALLLTLPFHASSHAALLSSRVTDSGWNFVTEHQ